MPPFKEIGSWLLSEKRFDEVDAIKYAWIRVLDPESGFFFGFSAQVAFYFGL